MARLAFALSLAGFVLFNYGQYRGWSLFADEADSKPIRSASAARTFHK